MSTADAGMHASPPDPRERQVKQARLADWLDRHKLDGVMLWRRQNFAWVTCGRDNHIANNTPVGVACVVATRDGRRVCLANAIEAPRMRGEELAGTGIEVVSFPWHDGAAGTRAARDVKGGMKIATDSHDLGLGLPQVPHDFNELRWSLTDAEIERYRTGARAAADAMEAACRALRPGMTEHEVAGELDQRSHAAGSNPLVTLVAADDRVARFRHPIPTDHKISHHVMLVTCAERAGLISCLTRFVHFGPLPAELKRRHQAVANVDAAVNLATRPGRTLGEVFVELQRAYAGEGFADEWQLHHQGGSTGYAPREAVAGPGSAVTVRENQAFAWNPSITGTKSEDTVLITSQGIEVLTRPGEGFPTLAGKSPAGELPRADILVL